MTLRARLASPAGVIWSVVALAVLVRLPFLHLPAWADEAGYLELGGHWHLGAGSRSLYGSYWVDRPPVLVTLYGWAQQLGGLTALRLLGALAATLTILGLADFARTVAGERVGGRAAAWTAVTAAALLSTPYHWSFMIDGELLAIPFVAWGLALTARAVALHGRRSLLAGAGAGALGIAAVLTKQDFLDVFVFQVVYAGLCWARGSLPVRRLVETAAAVLAGAATALLCLAVWASAHGTALSGVWYAMYQFRFDAARGATHVISFHRLGQLSVAAVLSGLLLVIAAGLVGLRRRGRRDPATWALLVLLGYDVLAVAAGTSYWLHYLLQPAVPAAALLGIVIARGARLRAVPVAAVVLAVLGVVALALTPPGTAEEVVGSAVGRVSERGDEILTWPGRSNVNYAAHLGSPYPYLWYLPAVTLDPGFRQLKALLHGDRRPTWLVAWTPVSPEPAPGSVAAVIREDYRQVALVCGREVFLRSDVDRQAPVPEFRTDATRRTRCRSVGTLPFPLDRLTRTGPLG